MMMLSGLANRAPGYDRAPTREEESFAAYERPWTEYNMHGDKQERPAPRGNVVKCFAWCGPACCVWEPDCSEFFGSACDDCICKGKCCQGTFELFDFDLYKCNEKSALVDPDVAMKEYCPCLSSLLRPAHAGGCGERPCRFSGCTCCCVHCTCICCPSPCVDCFEFLDWSDEEQMMMDGKFVAYQRDRRPPENQKIEKYSPSVRDELAVRSNDALGRWAAARAAYF